MVIARPALVVYAFAPKVLPTDQKSCEEALQYLRRLWDACTRLGMTQPVEGLQLPLSFPIEFGEESAAFRLLAAKVDNERRKSGADYQSFLFEYQDVFGLIATLETSAESATPADWGNLYDEWRSYTPDDPLPQGLLGEVLLFHALCEDDLLAPGRAGAARDQLVNNLTHFAGQAVMAALPGENHPGRGGTFHLTNTGLCLWEGEARAERRMVALFGQRSKQDEMFNWTTWGGTEQLAPFARYLMHASKVRFSQKVFERERPHLNRQRLAVDTALDRLLSMHDSLRKNQLVRLDEFESVQYELDKARSGGFGLLYSLSRLRELSLTVQIAEQNLARLVPAPPELDPAEDSIFRQDGARAVWLREQLGIELTYLEAVHQRAEAGLQIIATGLEFESRKSERQLNRLILLQGTLLGSILTGLAAVQTILGPLEGGGTPLAKSLKWSVVAVLMALALALPPLSAHWHERYRRGDLVAAGILGAALAWLGVTLWSMTPLVYKGASFGVWLLFNLLTASVGFCLGYFGAGRLERMKRRAR